MDSRRLRSDLEEEIRSARRRKRAAEAEGAECGADNVAGAAECRGEARAYRESVCRLGALLARVEAEDDWLAEGQTPSTIRNSLKPLQVIYRRARSREGVPMNPTRDLELPTPDPGEIRIVSPEVATRLIEAVPLDDRATWATALYAGLRYGELRALRWGAIDLDAATIRVRESWDPMEGSIDPKTRASLRTTPLPSALHLLLRAQRDRGGEVADDQLVFADSRGAPFHAASLYRRADCAWVEAGLTERLRLHQARHTYASFMIAAGVNAKALSAFMGHSSIKVTFDLYGHLMPGAEAEAAARLDAFLAP